MNRHFDRAILAIAIVAAAALVGCGSDSGNSGSIGGTGGGGADAGSTTDGIGAGKADGGSVGGGGGADTAGSGDDAGSSSKDECKENKDCKDAAQICKEGNCVQAPPCWDKDVGKPACKATEICDLKTDKCVEPTCTLPDQWTSTVNKVSKIVIPSDNTNACDFDDDGKKDNALGAALKAFSSQVKGGIEDSLASGKLVIALEADAWKTDGTEFGINALLGEIDPSEVDADGKPKTCDPLDAAKPCKYVVNKSSYDQLFSGHGQCPARISFNNARIDKNMLLTAGGPKQNFVLSIPVLASMSLDFELSSVTLTGTVTDAKEWKSTKGGRLCGILKKTAIAKAIDAVPDEKFAAYGGKEVVKQLVAGVLKADIDADQDGTKESVSVYIELETVPGTINGLK